MKIILESTSVTTEVNGLPARIWEGHTDSGIPCHAWITRIAVDEAQDTGQFETELVECRPPTNPDIDVWPNRMVL